MPPARKGRHLDDEAHDTLYAGASIQQMGKLFGRDKELIREALLKNQIKPSGMRVGAPIYNIAEVAHLCINPLRRLSHQEIERVLSRMNPIDLPKQLTKEFWQALRTRQAYQEEEGDLWRTEKVVTHMGEVFKTIKQSLLVGRDTVEKEQRLTDQQRLSVQRIFDDALNAAYAELMRVFSDDSHGKDEHSDHNF